MTTSTTAPTRHHLTDEQVRFFDENGYLVLRNAIPEDLLARLREASNRWIELGRTAADDWDSADFNFAQRASGRALFRVNYIHNKGEAASLELLGSPTMLGIAESLAGPNFVPTYESLVFKAEGDGAPVEWHQDALHPRTHRIFNVDLYLDSSRKGAGALRVAPGSHRQKVDICQLKEEYGWDAPGVVHVEMEPGDILIHDVMVVHGSEETAGNALRRTLYYEFRAAEQIIDEGPWDAEWVDRRMRLLPLALKEYAARNPDSEGFTWNVSDEFRPVVSADAEVELKVAHPTSSPSSFCSAGSVETPAHVVSV